jgi:hypothetical protein
MFSYKAQVDDNMEDDTVSLPHQQSFSSLKTDSDYIYQVSACITYLSIVKLACCPPFFNCKKKLCDVAVGIEECVALNYILVWKEQSWPQ